VGKKVTFAQAVNEALREALATDPHVLCYGLGIPDPKGAFGTTLGLQEEFGPDRVFDMPTSEEAMTGVAIGAALTGMRPVMTHLRMEFFLLAVEQLVNNAAKWHYTFAGRASVPLTVRLVIGRGWGQGPTHSQSLQAWFMHVPGLKVVMPTFAHDAKGLLLSAIFDDNPVLFLEHRWLHNQEGEVANDGSRIPLGKATRVREGEDITIVGMSYMTVEAMRAAECLEAQGTTCDVIDLRTISPLDWETVYDSTQKTGRILALDTSWETGSVSAEIVARVSMKLWKDLKHAPRRLGLPDFPVPTSFSLTKGFYPDAASIVRSVGGMLDKTFDTEGLDASRTGPHDVPGDWFRGPF